MYLQRYMQHFPAAGEVVIFDRSWYNRAGVERVMGFCSDEEYRRFLENCPIVEKYFVDGGIVLVKFWLEVGMKEQERRFEARSVRPMEAKSHGHRVVDPLVRLLSRAGRNAGSHRYGTCPVAYRAIRRQKTIAIELHFASTWPDPLRKNPAEESAIAQTVGQREMTIKQRSKAERSFPKNTNCVFVIRDLCI